MIPRIWAISPPRLGPWCDELELLVAEGLILRLLDQPDAVEAVLARVPAGLTVLVRPCRATDLHLGAGLHLPAHMDPADLSGRPEVLSASCHDAAELARAEDAGCDLVTLSPVRAPGSKPDASRFLLGFDGLAELCDQTALRVLALGGLGPEDLPECLAAGAWGLAGISAFFTEGRVRPGPSADPGIR